MPVKKVEISSKIVNAAQLTKYVQVFVNDSNELIEVGYRFPIDSESKVTNFTAKIGEKIIHSVTKRKEEAKTEYENAVDVGDGAYLLSQSRSDIFSLQLGNVEPSSMIEITITTISEIEKQGPDTRWSLQTSILPRYSGTMDDTIAVVTNTNTTEKPAYPISVSLHATMPSPITRVHSDTHGDVMKVSPLSSNSKVVEIKIDNAAEASKAGKEIAIIIGQEVNSKPSFFIELDSRTGQQRAALLSFFPKALEDVVDQPCEIIFVVDRSGSMSGSAIESAKAALQLFLRSLNESIHFNIVSFGSRFEWLFRNQSMPYTDATLKRAAHAVSTFKADFGGTEILSVLKDVYAKTEKTRKERKVKIIVLTDGGVSNTAAVINECASHAKDINVFTLGVGNSVSKELVRGMARAAYGVPEFVVPGESVEAKVIRQLQRALQPGFTDVVVDSSIPTEHVSQYPATIPPIYRECATNVYFLLKPGSSTYTFPSSFKVSGLDASRMNEPAIPWSETITVDNSTVLEKSDNYPITLLAAATAMKEASAVYAGRQTDEKSRNEAKETIIKLSLDFNLSSELTSFLAVEDRSDNPSLGSAKPVAIPVFVPGGGHQTTQHFGMIRAGARSRGGGRGGFSMMVSRMAQAPMTAQLSLSGIKAKAKAKPTNQPSRGAPLMKAKKSSGVRSMLAQQQQSMSYSFSKASTSKLEREEDDDESEEVSLSDSSDSFTSVTLSQNANGSWSSIPGPVAIAFKNASPPTGATPQEWATALCIAFFEKKYGHRESEWSLLVKKAKKWLSKQGTDKMNLIKAAVLN